MMVISHSSLIRHSSFVIGFALFAFFCSISAAQPVASLEASSVTILEGTPRVSIPLHLDADVDEPFGDLDGTFVSGLYATVELQPGMDAAFIDTKEEFVGSMFTKEAGKTITRIDAHSPQRRGILCIEWLAPFGEISADGLVAILTVDTSRLKAGRYTIDPGASGLTSATYTKDGLSWHVLRIRPVLGTITVRPKKAPPATP
jgi:hypothetical protein